MPLPEKKINLLCEYTINGMLAFHRYTLTHQELYTDEEISDLAWKISSQMESLFR